MSLAVRLSLDRISQGDIFAPHVQEIQKSNCAGHKEGADESRPVDEPNATATWHSARDHGGWGGSSFFGLTAEDIGADVGGTPPLVFQQVILAHQVFSQAEVCDGDPVSPGCTQTTRLVHSCVVYSR